MTLRKRCQYAWRGWTGKTELRILLLFSQLREAEGAAAKAYQLERDLGLANAAIVELKSQLPKDWEDLRKKESVAISEAVIMRMKNEGNFMLI